MDGKLRYFTFIIMVGLAGGPGLILGCHSGDNDRQGPGDDDGVEVEGVPFFRAIAPRPEKSVLPDGLTSCAVYKEIAFREGTLRRCELYDGIAGRWVEAPDPMLEQAYWYDRYYDLYHRMEGQYADLEFTEAMWPGTPESVWGDPAYFREHDGFGDGSGWTGTALWAAAARYLATGTEADYARMLDHFESMAFLYEATGIPGLLMRSHFTMLEPGAPPPLGNPGKAVTNYIEPCDWHFRYPLAKRYLDRLPAYYRVGVEIEGTHYNVLPVWMGDASRDMYVRSLPGVMLAYDMLGEGPAEDRLRSAIEREIPCTLRRMKKLRISNLQSNPFLLEALAPYLGTDRMLLEPGDIDLTKIDTLIGYVMEQPNPAHMGAFDAECPEGLPTEVDPAYDLDASNWLEFMVRFADIALRMQRQGRQPIAWVQFVSARGADALFVTQWALAAHYLTGDERYLDFLEGLMEEIDYWPIIDTYGSFWSPKWCRPHFGPSLLYPTLWNIQSRVSKTDFPTYWERLANTIMEESRHKELAQANDVFFGILYDNMVDATIDPQGHAYALEMVEMLRGMGQYQGPDKFEPRRNYTVDLLSNPPPGIEIEDLTQEDYDICMEPFTLFGIEIEPGSIEDELPRAVEGLPLRYRIPGPFQWQMDPFMLWRDYGWKEAMVQFPMAGMTVAFWNGRTQGTLTEGRGTALAWRDTGEACRGCEF